MAGLFADHFANHVNDFVHTGYRPRPCHTHYWTKEALNYPFGPREFTRGGPKSDVATLSNPPMNTVGLSPSRYQLTLAGRKRWEDENLRPRWDKTDPFDNELIAPGVPVRPEDGPDGERTIPKAWEIGTLLMKLRLQAFREAEESGFGLNTATGGGFGTGTSVGVLSGNPGLSGQSGTNLQKKIEGVHPNKLAQLRAQGVVPSNPASLSRPASTLLSGPQQPSTLPPLHPGFRVPPSILHGPHSGLHGPPSALFSSHPGLTGMRTGHGPPPTALSVPPSTARSVPPWTAPSVPPWTAPSMPPPTAPSVPPSTWHGLQSGPPTLNSAQSGGFSTALPRTLAPFGTGLQSGLPSLPFTATGRPPFPPPTAFSQFPGTNTTPFFGPPGTGFPSAFPHPHSAFASQFPTTG